MNTQPIEKVERDFHDDGLDIVNIWHTIQGEGPDIGQPAVFIRLAGCNLLCPLCDTDYTFGRRRLTLDHIMTEVKKYDARLVVLTGGEPLRQPIEPLLWELLGRGYFAQIETNGTFYRPAIPDAVRIVCSPKTGMIAPGLEERLAGLKYTVRVGEVDEVDGLPTTILGRLIRPARPQPYLFKGEIFIQPVDEKDDVLNKLNMAEAVRICLKYNYRLCLQVHKIAGLE